MNRPLMERKVILKAKGPVVWIKGSMPMQPKWLRLGAAALVLAVSCVPAAKEDAAHTDQVERPAPGEMRVVSVEPLTPPETIDPGNLIVGGNLPLWWPGAAAPKGFMAPDPKYSTLTRLSLGNDGRFVVNQKWLKPDDPQKLASLFRVEVPGIEPETEYLFEVTAAGKFSIDVWELVDQRPPRALYTDLIVAPLGNGMLKHYAKPIKSGSGRVLVIAAKNCAQPAKGDVVQWHRWRLVRSAGK